MSNHSSDQANLDEKKDNFENDYDYNREEQIKEFKASVIEQREGRVNMLEIIQTEPSKRTSEQLRHLVCHLQFKVPFFGDQKRALIEGVAERVECRYFRQGQVFIREGQIA